MRIDFDPEDVRVTTLTAQQDPAEIEQIIRLFEDAALEMDWQPGDQLRAYPGSSVYFALKIAGELQGAVQLVRGGTPEGLPCLTVWPELNLWERTDVADVALVAVRKAFRGQRHLYWPMYAQMWRYCVRNEIDELWMETPPEKVSSYRSLGWPLSIAGELRPHWEEWCYPCWVSVRGVGEAMIERARRRGSYRLSLEETYELAQKGVNDSRPLVTF